MTATPRPGLVRADPGDPDPLAGPAAAGWRIATLTGVHDETTFHTRIAAVLDFPGHYGRNADALWDCLTDLTVPTALLWTDWQDMAIGDPRGWAKIVTTLRDRGEQQPAFLVVLAADS